MNQLNQTLAENRELWELFYQQHSGTPRHLETMLELDSLHGRTKIYEQVHAVKGASETLHCGQLINAASLICDREKEFTKEDIVQFIQVLQTTLDGIEAAYFVKSKVNELDTMKQLIRQHNVAAKKLALKWSESYSSVAQPVCLKNLISCLNDFDFKMASAYLREYQNLIYKKQK